MRLDLARPERPRPDGNTVAEAGVISHHRRVPRLHQDELEIDAELVRRLVRQSMPQWADLAVEPLAATGSSNALFRLGDSLLARLPRQPGGSATIEKEARWLPRIGPALTVEVPEPVALGEPGCGYPERWAVTRWIPGETPKVPSSARNGEPDSDELALELARLLTELNGLDVPLAADSDPGLSWYRGGQLSDLDEDFRDAVEASRSIPGLGLDLDKALNVWGEVLAAEQTAPPRRGWYHGDMLAENLLIRDGRLAAMIDFGGLGVGDPSVDLIVAWEVLDARGRSTLRQALDVDDGTWAKGIGWALLIAMNTFPYYWHTMPPRCAARHSMADAVLSCARE